MTASHPARARAAGRLFVPWPRSGGADIPHDREACKARNLAERFFNKLKHFRAAATRYDKRDDACLASVRIASVRIWLRSCEPVA